MTGLDCDVMRNLIKGLCKKEFTPLFRRQKGAHLENKR